MSFFGVEDGGSCKGGSVGPDMRGRPPRRHEAHEADDPEEEAKQMARLLIVNTKPWGMAHRLDCGYLFGKDRDRNRRRTTNVCGRRKYPRRSGCVPAATAEIVTPGP
jgi:hypothetical protein